MRILIFGLPKTGTTALFYRITNALPSDYETYFERPWWFGPEQKKIVSKLLVHQKVRPVLADQYDKIIMTLRDPRDRLVSNTLYAPFHIKNSDDREWILRLIIQKERNPQSVSMAMLRECISGVRITAPLWAHESKHIAVHDRFIRDGLANRMYIMRYEDFVEDKIQGLEDFLGFELPVDKTESKILNRVARTKSSGDWKNWFTDSDVKAFKYQVEDFMERYNYSGWETNVNKKIPSEYASEYVKSLFRERSKR